MKWIFNTASINDSKRQLLQGNGLDEIVLHPAVAFLIGENGAGKSTLIEVIVAA